MDTTKHSVGERLRSRLATRKIAKSEEGLALIDVLIGVMIFGLLMIIAIAAISQYRARAYEASVVSDARQLGIAYELDRADMGYLSGPGPTRSRQGVTLTEGNWVNDGDSAHATYFKHIDNRSAVAFCVENENGAYAFWDSAAGGIVAKGRTGTCGAARYYPDWPIDPTVDNRW